ncbi:MAG TPA: ABC transporter ATP-binding protein [Gemmatimonadaceae bacterium]|jgi:ABC-type multidrug transport system ATPase subunit|nr:ABC transporter ATP-binding protein [Gemmatimonadaceae bacterium]
MDDGFVIALHGVTFGYERGKTTIDVPSLEVDGGLTLVVGQNGSGKSTLLRLIAGVEAPRTGSISVSGHDLWSDEVAARRSLAYVPESPELTPYATVIDVVQLVASLRGAPPAAVADALDRVGLFELGGRTVRELSMGQRRRAMLATALVGEPRVVILDEPLETLDAQMRVFVHDWVVALREGGALILLATHDLAAFAPLVDHVLFVERGVVAHHDLGSVPGEARRERLDALIERREQ